MTEPRMRQRQKGAQFPESDLEAFLYTIASPLPTPRPTLLTLDAIITDFIIETCHEASLSASLSNRQKIKLDDFKFMLRKDGEKLGRVQELLSLDKRLREERKIFGEEVVTKKEREGEKVGRGRGRRKKRAVAEKEDGGEGKEEGEERSRKKRAKSEEVDADGDADLDGDD